jgi:hypothetical protein
LRLVGASPLQLAYPSDARQDNILVLGNSVFQRDSFDTQTKCPSNVLGVLFKGPAGGYTLSSATQNTAMEILLFVPGSTLPLSFAWASDRAPVSLLAPAALFFDART